MNPKGVPAPPLTSRTFSQTLLLFALLPIALYTLALISLTWPWVAGFGRAFMTDAHDGFTNVWNFWWIERADRTGVLNPYFTPYLHYPLGTTLIAHTLNPFNAQLGGALLNFVPLQQAFNYVVIFSFIATGLTAFWLAWYVSRSYPGALLAGFFFTFSQYHFAHAQGHLNLIAMEWLPLFLLSWLIRLQSGSIFWAGMSAWSLLMNALCDYYYFMYAVLAGAILLAGVIIARRDGRFLFRRPHLISLLVFVAFTLLTSGALVAAILLSNARDPLVGSHPPEAYSLDLLGPFIPGVHWRFGELTRAYWSGLPGSIHETSVSLGFVPLGLAVYAWIVRRRQRERAVLLLWTALALFFFLLALGPVLHISGHATPIRFMPYRLLGLVIPGFSLSSVPVRMIIMTHLAVAVMAAIGVGAMMQRPWGRYVLPVLALVYCLEALPAPLPLTESFTPDYIAALNHRWRNEGPPDFTDDPPWRAAGLAEELDLRPALVDTVNIGGAGLYLQTQHERPISFGYIARLPGSVHAANMQLHDVINAALDSGDVSGLRDDYFFRYLLVDPTTPLPPALSGDALFFKGDDGWLIDLDAVSAAYASSANDLPTTSPTTSTVGSGEGSADGESIPGVELEAASPRLVLHDHGALEDRATNLMWSTQLSPTPLTWTDAKAYAELLTLAGHGDWRLPTRGELLSLYDALGELAPGRDRRVPQLDWKDSRRLWASTRYLSYTSTAESVAFHNGAAWYDLKTAANYVRPVRSTTPE